MDGTTRPLGDSQQTIHSIYSLGSDKNLVTVKARSAFLKKRRRVALSIVLVLSVLLATAVAGLAIVSMLYLRSRSADRYCETEECMRIASSLKEIMNTSVDPCDDFYGYVCGRWSFRHTPVCSIVEEQEHDWFRERSSEITRIIRRRLEGPIYGGPDDDYYDEENEVDGSGGSDDRTSSTTGDVPRAVRQAQILYDSCMLTDAWDELGLSPIFALLDELGLTRSPPLLTGNTSDFVVQLANVKRILGTDLLFAAYVDADPMNSTRNVVIIGAPEPKNPFPSNKILEKRLRLIEKIRRNVDDQNPEINLQTTKDNNNGTLEDRYSLLTKNYMSEVIKFILSNGTIEDPVCKNREPFDEVPELQLEKSIAKLVEADELFEELLDYYNNQTSDDDFNVSPDDYMTLDELQKITDDYVLSINATVKPKRIWKEFANHLFKDVKGFDIDRKILVADLDYLKNVTLLLTLMDSAVLESLIWWTVIDYSVPYSTKELRKIHKNYLDALIPYDRDCQVSLHCTDSVTQLMGMAVSWLYVNPKFYRNGEYDKMTEMLANIRESFKKFVKEARWMDKPTKSATLVKNDKMTSLIGYPEWLFDKDTLDDYYAGVNFSSYAYFENMIQLIRLEVNNSFNELSTVNDKSKEPEWPIDPTEVNALHVFQFNQIAVPAAILQFPFYELGLESLNYGAIGSIIGHELTHGFDNTGRLFDGDGNMKQWWTSETVSKYTENADCFIEQYGKYYEQSIGEYVDGRKTLGENIADNGGFRQAYNAYQLWKRKHPSEPKLPGFSDFSHEQLLFLSYGHMWCESFTKTGLRFMLEDSHSPSHVRLRRVLQNSKEFSETWNCPVGSPMNPKNKCQLW